MAIITEPQGSLPTIQLDRIHFAKTNIAISEEPPYRIAVSAKVRLYGVHEGVHYYDREYKSINITDLTAYIGGLEPAKQLEAAQALTKVEEGLGKLAELKLGINFVNVQL